jgi:HNH endonuclease
LIQRQEAVLGSAGTTHTDTEIVDHLRSSWGLSGSTSVAAYRSYCKEHPKATRYLSVVKRFGSWEAALVRAGLDSSRASKFIRGKEFTDQYVAESLQQCAKTVGRAPTISEYEQWRRQLGPEHRIPGSAILRRRYGGWGEALRSAGLVE